MSEITILLPVYNGEKYLSASIGSVLNQRCVEFELLILDDGSSDKSREIAQSYSDKRIRFLPNPSRYGLFKTLNRGFLAAKNDLVRLWAQDDIMLNDSLAGFARATHRHPAAGLYYCDFYAINELGERTAGENAFVGQRLRTPELADASVSAALFLCFGCLPGNISTVLLRKAMWSKVGGFVEGLQQAPDYEMWVRLSDCTDVCFIPEKLIELRDHPHQASKIGQKQMTTIIEEFPVFVELTRRLKGRVPIEAMMRVWLHHRGRQHFHWVIRAVLRGDMKNAAKGWRAIDQYGQRQRQALFWLLSANGKFFTKSPAEYFDEIFANLAPER